MKNVKLKSVIVLLLMLSMISAVLFGCSNAQNVKDEKDLSASEEQASTETIEKTETIFTTGRDFSEGVAWVSYSKTKDCDTLIDSNGNVLFTLTDDSAKTDFVNGVALTYDRLIDKNNNTLFDPLNESTEDVKYSIVNCPVDNFYGYTFVKVDTNTYDSVSTKVGVLDNKGAWYREPSEELSALLMDYDQYTDCVKSQGFGLYYVEEKPGKEEIVYNLLTNEVSHDKNKFEKWKNDYLIKYSESLAFSGEQISTNVSGHTFDYFDNSCFNDSNGNRVMDLSKYRIYTSNPYNFYIPTFRENYCALELCGADWTTHYVTIIDKQGNEQFAPLKIGGMTPYEMKIGNISNGLLAISGLGYIDLKGKVVIPEENLEFCTTLQSLGDFSENGIAKIQTHFDGVYYIDITGKIAF